MISFKLIRTAILSVSRGKNKLQNFTIYLVNFTLLGIENWQRQRPASRSNKSGLGSLALHLLPVLPLARGMKKKKKKNTLEDSVYLPQVHNYYYQDATKNTHTLFIKRNYKFLLRKIHTKA